MHSTISIFLVVTFISALLGGCGSSPYKLTDDKILSLEEAKEVTLQFSPRPYIPPKKSIDDIRLLLGEPREIPRDCSPRVAERDKQFVDAIDRVVNAKGIARGYLTMKFRTKHLAVVAEARFPHGGYKNTLESMDKALGAMPSGLVPSSDGKGEHARKWVLKQRSAMFLQLARMYASLGDKESALDHYSTGTFWWNWTEKGKADRDLTESLFAATLAHAEGDLPSAEAFYRKALYYGRAYAGGDYNPAGGMSDLIGIDIERIRSDLALCLLQQGRIAEAELEGRRALIEGNERNGVLFVKGKRYNARLAYPASIMAEILIEQRRFDEALYLARMAMNMHQFDCSAADSALLAHARKILARLHAENKEWQQVLEIFHSAEDAMQGDPEAFEALYKDSTIWPLALVKLGKIEAAKSHLQQLKTIYLSRDKKSSAELQEVAGLLAVVAQMEGRLTDAYPLYKQAIGDNTTYRAGSVARLIDTSYMALLANHSEQLENTLPGLVVAEELFHFASAKGNSRVQRAVAASASRATLHPPPLAKLARQEQDAKEELSVLIRQLDLAYAEKESRRDKGLLQKLQQRRAHLLQAQAVLQAEISKQFPDYADLISGKAPSVKTLQHTLHANEALLFTYSSIRNTFVWVLNKQQPIRMHIADIGRDELGALAKEVQNSLWPTSNTIDSLPTFNGGAAFQIYQLLLQPLEQSWKNGKQIVGVLSFPFDRLPLHLLPTKNPVLQNDTGILFAEYRDIDWLGTAQPIFTIPSTATLTALRTYSQTSRPTLPFLGFGDPAFTVEHVRQMASPGLDRLAQGATTSTRSNLLRSAPQTRGMKDAGLEKLPRLPETRTEILAVADALGAKDYRSSYLGVDATEEKVKEVTLDDYRILSFATHGLTPGEINGLTQTALALSSPEATGTRGDGLLTAGEILGLKLNADWVILSACNTAAGDTETEESVSGLGRAFFYSGARALLASNWPVHSDSTLALIQGLFAPGKSNITKAEALQASMANTIVNGGYKDREGNILFSYAHPLFWAPFIIIGEGNESLLQQQGGGKT